MTERKTRDKKKISIEAEAHHRASDLRWLIHAAHVKRSIWGFLLLPGSEAEVEIQQAKTAAVIRVCRQARSRSYSIEELFAAVIQEIEERGFKPFPGLLSIDSPCAFARSLDAGVNSSESCI